MFLMLKITGGSNQCQELMYESALVNMEDMYIYLI